VAYRADIEIAVKGGREITDAMRAINKLGNSIDVLNRRAKLLEGKNFNVASVENYSRAVAKAERALRRAADGTEAQRRAVEQVITARERENALIGRTNYLLAQEAANRRKVQVAANAGFGQQGAALPPSMRNAGFGQQGPALPPRGGAGRPGGGAGRPGGGGGGKIRGIVSNAIIGGAFPLLFGQGGSAATGGAIGGAVGDLFGGTAGFAGSLLGTLLGQIAGQANQVKELASDIGFSARQTQLLSTAFKQAGAEFDKFQASVVRIQGLGLSLEDQAAAIQLSSTLTEAYNGKIDKLTNAFTNALQTGKVTQATLNQLTNEGIPIQEALATKYNVSRSALLQMAKDGKISVQDLLDTLVNLANESAKGAPKLQSSYEIAFKEISSRLQTLADNVATAFSGSVDDINTSFDYVVQKSSDSFTKIIDALSPLTIKVAELAANLIDVGTQAATALLSIPNYVESATNAILLMIPGLRAVVDLFSIINNFTGGNRQQTGQDTGMYGRYVPGSQQQQIKTAVPRITRLGQMTPAGGGSNKADKAASDAAREAERVAKLLRDTRAETELLTIQAALQDRIFQAEQAKDPLLAARLKGEEDILNIQAKYAEILANEPNTRAQEAIVVKGLQEIENARLKTAQNLEKIEADRVEKFQDIITGLERQNELDAIKDERVRALREIEFQILDYKKQGLVVSEAEAQLYRDMAAARIKGPGAKRMEELQTSITELTNTENIAIAAADNIGQAFGNAFQEIVTGASSGQEAIANMMKSIGENFVNMAAQIIAQQITMMILGTILKALGIGFSSGGGGGGGGGAGVNVTPGGSIDPLPGLAPGIRAANGAYFSNGIAAFAAGGIVNRPTLFKFANGGTTQTGLMGEAGPEAIMPLQRDGSGRLGVNAMGLREAMAGGGMGGGAPVLNMSFETTRFGDTEYVSRDQLEAAMAATRRQAARDGAQRGMTMTLDRIQQSPQTRSRLGMR